MMVETVYWFEDMHPGLTLRSARGILMEADAISAFARTFDPHPAHLSEETAKATLFGRHCASGWHTAVTTMRLVTETLRIAGGGAGAGIDALRWLRPVYPGDELRVEVEVLAVRPSLSRPKDGVVTYRISTFNQHNDLVQEFTTTVLMPRREA